MHLSTAFAYKSINHHMVVINYGEIMYNFTVLIGQSDRQSIIISYVHSYQLQVVIFAQTEQLNILMLVINTPS